MEMHHAHHSGRCSRIPGAKASVSPGSPNHPVRASAEDMLTLWNVVRERPRTRPPWLAALGRQGLGPGAYPPLSYRRPRGPCVSTGDPRRSRPRSPVMLTKPIEDAHSEPLFRKGFQHISPPLGGPGPSAWAPRGHRPQTPSYYIINEQDSHKNSHPTFWPERHFRMDALGDLVEVYPRSTRQAVSRGPRQGGSPQLSEEDEDAPRRQLMEGSFHPHAPAGLRGPPHFYVGERSERQTPAPKRQGRVPHGSWSDGLETQLDRPVYVHKKPRSRGSRYPQHPPNLRDRPEFEPPLTESDSVSAASSSDQRDSSRERYFWVPHGQGRFPRPALQLGRRKATSRQELIADLNDLVCSNV